MIFQTNLHVYRTRMKAISLSKRQNIKEEMRFNSATIYVFPDNREGIKIVPE